MRRLSIPQVNPTGDGIVRVPIVLEAVGDEVNLQFGITFDQSKYSFNYVVLSDVPIGTGYGSSTGYGFANIGLVGTQPFSPGTHTIAEIGLTAFADPGSTARPIIEFALLPRDIKDAGDYPLDATYYSANAPVTSYTMEAPQLTPIGAVIDPVTGEVTVGHIDPVTGTVHVAANASAGNTIFGFSPIVVLIAAGVGLFLFTRN